MTARAVSGVTERDGERAILEAARILGYRVHVERPALSRRGRWATPITGDAGWPDVIVVGHGRIFAAELKVRPGGARVTDDQRAWIAELTEAGVTAMIVEVPAGLGAFLAELTHAARGRGRRGVFVESGPPGDPSRSAAP